MNSIALVELNEVPNSVLDEYARRSPFMADFLQHSDRYETIAADQIQLDPWVAWPSFHRGVPDTVHGLLRLGQSADRADQAHPPVWRLLAKQGVSVGVYGSLFSNTETDLSPYEFFVPDVFSPHSEVKPRDLTDFQSFNLTMTRASARNPSEHTEKGAARIMMDLALSGRLRAGTMARVAKQLASEAIQPTRLSRRRNVQTELHGDIYLRLREQYKPDFTTFYTNNVAAAMHRFWSASFKEGSINSERLASDWVKTYSNEVFEALYSVERVIRGLVSSSDKPTIVVASAIGQDEIPAGNHRHFLSIVDVQRLIRVVEPDLPEGSYELLPTMVPDYTLRFADAEQARRFGSLFATLTLGDMRAIKTLERMKAKDLVEAGVGHPLLRHNYSADAHFKHPITFEFSDPRTIHLSFQIDDYEGERHLSVAGRRSSFEEAGIGALVHAEGVNCTAQHCAEGSLTVHRPAAGGAKMRQVSALDFVPSLLAHFGVASAAPLPGKPSITMS